VRPPSPKLVEHLRCAAGRYFADLDDGPAEVTLVDAIRTANADLHRFELRRGDRAREVVVKSRRIRPSAPEPGLTPPMPTVPDRLKVGYEMRALEAIDAHFNALARSSLGAVRPLEVLVPDRVFVMEAAPGETLAHSLARLPRRADPPDALLASVRHSGVWLREFHRLPPLEYTDAQPDTRDAFLVWLRRLVGFFEPRTPGRFGALLSRVESAAQRALPGKLPRGVGHGDFHAGNLIVDASCRVRIIDTFAAWSGPVYYDLSQYLYALKAPSARMYEQGLRAQPAHVAAAEREFLHGYFADDPVPLAAIRLFEIQWLLYRWVQATRASRRPGAIGRAKRVRLALRSRFVRSLLAGLVCELDAADPLRA
jgi:hypothetical protein